MKTFKLVLYAPNSRMRFVWKTAQANSIQEFAEICDNDSYLYELFNNGWTIATVNEVK